MKEINLLKMSSSPAPDEWKDLPEVKEQRPTGAGYDVSLQRLDIDGIDICLWEIKKSIYWIPYSDLFLITKQ